MNKFSKIIISLFGLGFIPIAPGTFASLFSLIFFYIISSYLSFVVMIFIFLFIFLLSIKLIDLYSDDKSDHDSPEIVIDEFLGIFFIIIFYEYFKFTNDKLMFFLIFIIFRFFDIFKVFPANWVDRKIKNSFGVILDDIIASIYSLLLLFILNAFL
tara:strand:+ start:328 stop:795 length:468 start_codon:yes stop_codon:yes gene_type:complete